MAAHWKSDRRRDDLCGGGLRKRAKLRSRLGSLSPKVNNLIDEMIAAREVRCRNCHSENSCCGNEHPPARLGGAMLYKPPQSVFICERGSRNESRLRGRGRCEVVFEFGDGLSHDDIQAGFTVFIHTTAKAYLGQDVGKLSRIDVI